MLRNKMVGFLIAVIVILTTAVGGCKNSAQLLAPPYIPSSYYDCIETYPTELIHAYFAGYGEIWGPMQKYNNKVFVFKNNPLDQWVIRDLDKGWIWLDLIKCNLANPEVMDSFQIGDKFDLVGFNLGPEDVKTSELTFRDCYVMRCGALKLPADGMGGVIGPGY